MAQSNPTHGLPLSVPSGTITLSAAALHLYDQSKLIEQDAIQRLLQVEHLQSSLDRTSQTLREETSAKKEAVAEVGKWIAWASQKVDEADAAKQNSQRLGMELEVLRDENKSLGAKVSVLEDGAADVPKLKAAMETLSEEKTLLEASSSKVEAALEVVQAEKQTLEASSSTEIKQLKDRIAAKTTEAFGLRSELEEANDSLASLQAAKTTALQAVVDVTRRNNELSAEITSLKQRSEELQSQHQNDQQVIFELKAQQDQLEKQLSLVVLDKTKLQESLRAAEVSNGNLESDKHLLERKLSDTDITVKKLWTGVDELKGELQKAEKEKAHFESAMANQSQLVVKLKAQLKQCSQENVEVHRLQKQANSELQAERIVLTGLRGQAAALESQIEALRQRSRLLAANSRKLVAAYSKGSKRRTLLTCIASSLSDQASSTEKQVAELEKQLKSKDEALATFSRQRAGGSKHLQTAQPRQTLVPALPAAKRLKQEETESEDTPETEMARGQLPTPRTPPLDGARVKFSLPKTSPKTIPTLKQAPSPLLKRKPAMSLDPRLQKKSMMTAAAASARSATGKHGITREPDGPSKRECRRDYWSCCKDHL